MSRTRNAVVLALALLALAATPASAQSGPPADRFRLDLGGFFQQFDTTVRYDRSNGTPGTEFSLEDVLGQDAHQTNFRADGYWRFGPHGRLDFGYRGWRRTNSRTLSQEIHFGDNVYQVGAQVDTEMSVNVADVYYAYSFVNTGVVEAGLGLGVSTYWNKFAFEATGSVTGGGGTTAGTASRESRNVIAPIPAIQAHLRGMLLEGLYGEVKVKGLKATIGDYSGSMVDFKAALDYRWTHFGIGAAYYYVDITYEQTFEQGQQLRFVYKYSGPLAYAIISF